MLHGGAYVYVYVEDTSERELHYDADCEADCDCCPSNFEPRLVLEIADCNHRVALAFDADTAAGRENSLHKLDTLAAAIGVFRVALELEFQEYDRRERELAEARE